MGTWIEIRHPIPSAIVPGSFPAIGTWIEIVFVQSVSEIPSCRSLYWERGLKFVMPLVQFAFLLSFPVLGTQIEMINVWNCHMVRTGSFNIGRMLQTDY